MVYTVVSNPASEGGGGGFDRTLAEFETAKTDEFCAVCDMVVEERVSYQVMSA